MKSQFTKAAKVWECQIVDDGQFVVVEMKNLQKWNISEDVVTETMNQVVIKVERPQTAKSF